MDTDYGRAISFGDGGGDTGERDLADSPAPSSLISLDSRASERHWSSVRIYRHYVDQPSCC